MRIVELIFQDLFGCVSPVRLVLTGEVASEELPNGVTPENVQDLLISLLYVEKTPHGLRMDYAKGDPKVALILDASGKRHRIVRKGPVDSLRLQMDDNGNWKDLAASNKVESFLRQNMGLPEFDVFWCLNLWRYEQSPSTVAAFDLNAVDARSRDLIARYQRAREVEAAEDAVKFTESRIAELRRELGQGFALEDKLAKAREILKDTDVTELSREDLDILRQKDRLLADFKEQIDRLSKDEEEERNQVADSLPERPYASPIFVAGLVVGLIGLGVGVAMSDTPWRAAALADVVGFGACVWVLIGYFSRMEKASLHQVRLESIKRRLNQVREEQVSLQERLNHVLVHARVTDANDLDERVARAEKLKIAIEKMDEQVQDLRRDPNYQRAREELDALEVKVAENQKNRNDMPADMMSAYQLEADLESIGIDVKSLTIATQTEDDGDSLTRLLDVARRTNQVEADALWDKTRKMWGKISGHILGDRFKDVDLDANGRLVIGSLGPEQVEMWARTRPSEQQVVWCALAISLQVNAPERTKRGFFESLVVPDPSQVLTADQSKKITDVLSSAARRSPALLLRSHA
ncbi:MAG: hypothetical protein R3E66_19710 [bacterium]